MSAPRHRSPAPLALGVVLAALSWAAAYQSTRAAGSEPDVPPATGDSVGVLLHLSTADSTALRHALDVRLARYVQTFKDGDSTAFAALYAKDGARLWGRGYHVTGRRAIATLMGPIMRRLRLVEGVWMPSAVWRLGDTVYDSGRYTFVFHPVGRSTQTDQGRYLMIWRRGPGGGWEIERDITIPFD